MASHTPHIEDTPGAWPETPAGIERGLSSYMGTAAAPSAASIAHHGAGTSGRLVSAPVFHGDRNHSSGSDTITRTPGSREAEEELQPHQTLEYAPIAAANSSMRPDPGRRTSSRQYGTNELMKVLSRRRTGLSATSNPEMGEEEAEIERLMSRMFGKGRQNNSEEEKTRHVGVIFKNLTVKGVGLGAALQPTVGDIFLGLPRKIVSLFNRNKKIGAGPPIKTIINNFSGVIRPGEMVLVLGRPGSGCSTFLKVLGNQRAGFKSVDGTVTYGGASAAVMAKEFRGEVLYNPEDDLHYATLSVQRTLEFALKTRTPGKESRMEGETRGQYIETFLKTITQLFWISHTLKTYVGDEHRRGVSGGERKRVSIAEAMITKASTQMWDNSTRGLDASTALEYVNSIRSLTNMANISTAVALYQAGESLYKSFDKVLLIEEGRCCYYGSADDAAAYFEDLGFERPARWTTADFLTSVTDEHERQVKKGWEDRIPRSPEHFEAVFQKSHMAEKNEQDIVEFEAHIEGQKRERESQMTKKTQKKNYTLPFHKQVLACTQRQFLVMIGDKQSLYGKWGGLVFQGLIVGSLFYNMPKTSSGVFERGGVIFFMLLFNALLALAELTAAFTSRPILLKHKSFSFYRPSAYGM
ncbi:MAG: hypothetical protein M1818_003340 [Claussenomyces sp. TS43310]|nr:MAG: hypothetical protein M1818_003340 [Claussenomyces sp. TS43310]